MPPKQASPTTAPAKTSVNPQGLSEQELVRQRINYRLNDVRLQPIKQLPMTFFMMWMVGNEVSIFSIMFVGMAVITPIQSIFNVGAPFADFEEDAKTDRQIASAVNQSKLIFIACCFAAFVVALVKLSWMELLPISAMDWIANAPPAYKEHSIRSFM